MFQITTTHKVKIFYALLLTFITYGTTNADTRKLEGWQHELSKLTLIKSNGKTRTIPSFKTIKVWRKGTDEVVKGRYTILNDSTIEIAGTRVPIVEITKISGLTWPSFLSVPLIGGGAVAMGYGAVLTYFGAYMVYANGITALWILGAGAGLAGVGVAAIVTGAVIWHYSKTFSIGEKWSISITETDGFLHTG